MHNKRLQLARASHWHIVINVLACTSHQSEEAQSNLGAGRGGGGSRSDPGIIVGDSGPSQAAGVGRGSGLRRTLKNCKFPLHRLNMCPAELGARTQNGTERRERRGGGEGGNRKRKKSVLHSQMILIWCGLECNLDQT